MSVGTFNQTWYYNSTSNHTIPGNARDIVVQVAGGCGGSGSGGGSGGNSRRAIFSIPGNFLPARTFKGYPGKKGGNGSLSGGLSGGVFYGGSGGTSPYSYQCGTNCMHVGGFCYGCPSAYQVDPAYGGCGGYCNQALKDAGIVFCACCQNLPVYCTAYGGGGGAGGGASVVYINDILAVVIGGGGGGGGSSAGGNGATTSAISATTSISGVSVGISGSGRGSSGGTGGGGASAGSSKAWTQSSLSRYNSNLVSLSSDLGLYNQAAFISLSYTTVTPEITSFSSNRSSIILGGYGDTPSSFTFSFDAIDYVSLELTGPFGPTGQVQTITYYPGDTLTYTWTPQSSYSNGVTITLKGITGSATDTSTLNLTVYQPPTINVTVDDASIILGGNSTVRWTSTGDCDTLVWTSGGLTDTNLNGSSSITPTVSTTYSAYVQGLGGISPLSSASIIVYEPPRVEEFTVPSQIDYGDATYNIQYDTLYANTSLTVETFNTGYTAGPNSGGSFKDQTFNLTPATTAEAAQLTAGRAEGILAITPQWDDFGPRTIIVRISGQGNGGSFVLEEQIPVIIDETPENLNIPELDGILKDQDPVIVPDTEIVTETLLIDDIDIPVEIKASQPIKVDVNGGADWEDVRVIGSSPPTGGNSLPSSLSSSRLVPPERSGKILATAKNSVPDEDPPTFDLETTAASFSFVGGANSVAFMQGGSATFTWNLSGGYTSASITNHGALAQSGSAITYNTRTIFRWFGPNPPPGDHMCALSNPGGYTSVIALCQFFTTAPPGSFGGFDAEAPGVKPQSGLMGYVWPVGYLPPGASTQLVYEFIDPNGGTPTGFGTIWTLSSTGEGPYTIFIQAFRVPTAAWTDYSGISFNGSATKSPTTTTSYTLTATGPYVGTYTKTITATVYVPPTIAFTSSLGLTIIAGQSTTIAWTVYGDGNSISWTSGDITNTNINSSSVVSPIDTTTYCAVASGLGGVSPNTCITITVYQIPTIEQFTVPSQINYGDATFDVFYDTKYANSTLKLEFFNAGYNSGPNSGSSFLEETVNLTPSGSAALGNSGAQATGTITYNPQWDNFGPRSIIVRLSGNGQGGSFVREETIVVNIDETPDNIDIEESEDKLKDEQPIFTPETEVVSEMYLVDDIDIPVEIKSDQPILVDINKNDNWQKLREI